LAVPRGVPVSADDRQEPIDIILVLDKSLSMEEEIAAVREYVNVSIVDQMLIPGDFLMIITFYGQSETLVARRIQSEQDKQEIKDSVSRILADGRFTDIGRALDVLGEKLAVSTDPSRRKHLLLITDGRQEAPPGSKYYSPDGSFNHEFLANTKVIQKQGWKVHVLGIGTRQEAQKLAVELSGTYSTVADQVTSESLAAQTTGLFGRTELTGRPALTPINHTGKGTLTLHLTSREHPGEVEIRIRAIRLTLPDRSWDNVLDGPSFAVAMPREGSRTAEIPVQLADPPAGGDYRASLQFFFTEGEAFLPTVTELQFRVQSVPEQVWQELQVRWWLLPAAAVLLALVVLMVVLLVRLIRWTAQSHVRFRVAVEGQPGGRGEGVYALREGEGLFVDEVADLIRLDPARSARSVARLFVATRALRMSILRQERFPRLKEIPQDIRGETFRIRTESGKDLFVRFERMEQNG
jgi:Mg-chelatase subunit ChlD